MKLMKYRTEINQQDSWGLLPIEDGPIVSGVYDPEHKVLALVYRAKKDGFMMMPRLDNVGRPELINKGGATSDENFKHERTRMERYYEHYLTDKRDIDVFLTQFVINNFEI